LFAVSSERNTRRRALLGTVLAITLPVAAIIALHRLGSMEWLRIDFADLDGWARRNRVEDAFAAVLRYVALAGAYWLALSSAAYLLARLSGVARLIDTTAVLTLPAVRRVTDRLVIGTLAVSTLAGPAIAVTSQLSDRPPVTTADPIASRLEAGEAQPDASDQFIDLTALDEADLEELAPPPRPLPPPNEAPTDEPPTISIRADAHLEVIVTEGDHLWALAERRVSEMLGRPAADHEIAPYWRNVIISNPELRSGNPDVIYPGEVIVLPPLD
jgi:nucleoid-associated protein YgaU